MIRLDCSSLNLIVPNVMILPSGCRTTSWAELGMPLNLAVTMPFEPKLESNVPPAARAFVADSNIVMTPAVNKKWGIFLKNILATMVFPCKEMETLHIYCRDLESFIQVAFSWRFWSLEIGQMRDIKQ
jgi:hypothetical protein